MAYDDDIHVIGKPYYGNEGHLDGILQLAIIILKTLEILNM